MTSGLKIAVIGAGAIGGTTAALIAKAGWDVELVCKYPELAQKVRDEGLLVTGARGEHRVKMPAVARVDELSGPKDIVLHATKATAMEEAARALVPFLTPGSLVVSMQNGVCEYAMADIVGMERTVGCVVGWGGTMVNPGHLEMTSTGHFVLGYVDRPPDQRLETIRNLLSLVAPVRLSEHIIADLYSKLIINASITSMGAITGMYLGRMLSSHRIRNIFLAIMKEAVAVANAMDMKIPPYDGKLDYYRLTRGNSVFSRFYRHLVLRVVGFKYRRLKSSSLQSLERGRPTEVDFLNGFIRDQGAKHGVPTPVNTRIIEIIHEIEAGKREISPKNLNDPVFRGV